MLTGAVIIWFLGLVIAAGCIVSAALAKSGINIFKRAVRNGLTGRVGAGLSAGRRVGRTARLDFIGALIASKALRRVV